MRPYTLSAPAKRAQRAQTFARIVRAVLAVVGFFGFEGMLLSLAHASSMPLWFFVSACVAFASGVMGAVYMHTFAIPRLDDKAFDARWGDPAYVAYMSQFRA